MCFFNQWFLDGGNSAGMLATLVHANDEIVCHEMATSIAAILEAKEVGGGVQFQGYIVFSSQGTPVLCAY